MTVAATERRQQTLTIGAVCRRLREEFPDVSISKIRYLEDQGLLTPKRTRGGYRLFSEEDVERLRMILRLQRDEFLPLRVIRQHLASPAAAGKRRRRLALEVESEIGLEELCERAGVSFDLVRELEAYGVLEGRGAGGARRYGESDAEIALACAKLAEYGIAPRHLRTFRSSADREANLLEQVLAPALRSRNAERRKSALDDLQALATLAQELSMLLFWRNLRRLAR
ncbi:MAG: MerR family transcriptional regulator [Actinomycetota bacterium]|nr:MerR family transcriptional regulator [Actinomycetota bacterium]